MKRADISEVKFVSCVLIDVSFVQWRRNSTTETADAAAVSPAAAAAAAAAAVETPTISLWC